MWSYKSVCDLSMWNKPSTSQTMQNWCCPIHDSTLFVFKKGCKFDFGLYTYSCKRILRPRYQRNFYFISSLRSTSTSCWITLSVKFCRSVQILFSPVLSWFTKIMPVLIKCSWNEPFPKKIKWIILLPASDLNVQNCATKKKVEV